MRGKLFGFAVALLAVATVGIIQLQSEAAGPGTVGSSSRCTVTATGARSSAFKISGNTATVNFKVTGAKNCRVQVSANSFYAPSMTGHPYSKQTLYQRQTRTYGPGTYNLAVALPASSTSAKGCYYQVDLTYGTYNHQPVLAYGHGKLNCGTTTTPPKPAAECTSLSLIPSVNRTNYQFIGRASVANGAKVTGYVYNVYNGSTLVKTITANSSSLSSSVNYSQTQPGTYTVKLTVNTTVGAKTQASCVKTFTVPSKTEIPVAACKEASVETIDRTNFKFNATSEVSGGATVSGYVFTVYNAAGQVVGTPLSVASTASSASANYSQAAAGDYTVKATVKTSLGDKTSSSCEAKFSVKTEDKPGVAINKLVDGVDYKKVETNVAFNYQIKVTNTGNVDLTNVAVTDTPDAGVTLVSASQGAISANTWSYTVPTLKVGESQTFTLSAKVPEAKAGQIKNTACVDTPTVPGAPDDCDDAYVEVPPKPVTKCEISTGNIVTISEEDYNKNPSLYADTDSDKCAATPETPSTPETPTTETELPAELPTTGAGDVMMKLFGAASVTGAAAYYVASRRNQ